MRVIVLARVLDGVAVHGSFFFFFFFFCRPPLISPTAVFSQTCVFSQACVSQTCFFSLSLSVCFFCFDSINHASDSLWLFCDRRSVQRERSGFLRASVEEPCACDGAIARDKRED